MKPSFQITPRAYEDLKAIARYTLQRWGKKQRDLYIQSLDRRFQWLAENPTLGKKRTDIHPDYYSFPQGQHVIFYMRENTAVHIIGILHQSMDVMNYFE